MISTSELVAAQHMLSTGLQELDSLDAVSASTGSSKSQAASSQPETLISDLAATTPTSSELSEPDEAPAAASGAKPKALPTALARPFARTQSAPFLSAVPKRVAPRKAPKSEDALPELSDDELPDAMSASLQPRSTCPPVSASQTIRGKRKAEELDSRLTLPCLALVYVPRGNRWWPARVLRFEATNEKDLPRPKPYEVAFASDTTDAKTTWCRREDIATPYEDIDQFRSCEVGEYVVSHTTTDEQFAQALLSLTPRLASISQGRWPAAASLHRDFLDQPRRRAAMAQSTTIYAAADRAETINRFCLDFLHRNPAERGAAEDAIELFSEEDRGHYVAAVLAPMIIELLEVIDEEELDEAKPDTILEAHVSARQHLTDSPSQWAHQVMSLRRAATAAGGAKKSKR